MPTSCAQLDLAEVAAGRGLTSAEAAERHRRDGPNILATDDGLPWWRELLAQMVHFFALLLWVAGVLALIGGLPQLGTAIFVVVVFNGTFSFLQERKAHRATLMLRDMLPRRVLVVRNGVLTELDAADLVAGDLVLISAGDRVPADLVVVECHGLTVDVSILTGESVPDSPAAGDSLFAGTFVVEGEARAVVVATGSRTRLAGISQLTRNARRPRSQLQTELHRLVVTIAIVAVAAGGVFFLTTLLIGTPPSDGFVFAIGVTVALVPEGLLPTVTLSLAVGAQRMAKQHALVRHLEAVETLGATTFVCTDKTGTLTRNEMVVVEVWTPHGRVRVNGQGYEPHATVDGDNDGALEDARHAAVVATVCSTGRVAHENGEWTARGDPMEAAIDALRHRLGVADTTIDELDRQVARRFPFDPRRRRMSISLDRAIVTKGGPDSVRVSCLPGDDSAWEAAEEYAARGLRVLAVASRTACSIPQSADDAERDLRVIAMLAIHDPPRAEAAPALDRCRRDGIRVMMITGDHPGTAAAVAAGVGLSIPGVPVVLGQDLPADGEALGAFVDRDGLVVARANPEDKLRIARALQARGHVVAMTGDGVNDGPALSQADIGVAMGRHGSDVAREAADLVLLDDNFTTIVTAIDQGRSTYANMRRFLTYHLTDNVAELTPLMVWALSATNFPLALGVLQILALDLATDTFSAVALGAEPPSGHSIGQPARGRLLDRRVARRAFGVLGPTEAVMAMGAFVVSLWAGGWRLGEDFPAGAELALASGATFTSVVIAQTANAFACRSSTRPVHRMSPFGNPMLLASSSLELVLAALLLVTPALAHLLDHSWPSLAGFSFALLAAPAVLVADAAEKAHHRRGLRRHPSHLLGSSDPADSTAVGSP